ncbi:MAG: hypothetical protein U0931_40210 [Vulcanimicrobiota bacterium]
MSTSQAELRQRLSSLSRSLHTAEAGPARLDQPLSHKSDRILFDGRRRARKRIVLLTVGCAIATCTMCPFPSESHPQVRAEHLIEQFESSLAGDRLENYEVLTLFCNGNFFNPKEIEAGVREHIFRRARAAGVSYVVVESLPQYLTAARLETSRRQLGASRLCVFIGLQSADEFVRNVCINTTCSRAAFEAACERMLAVGDIPAAFLMIKPPFLTEQESIRDVLLSLDYLGSLGVTHVTLCPARVAPRTLLARLQELDQYQPASVWALIDILLAFGERGPALPMVNTTELKDELNADSLCFQACSTCKERLIVAVEQFLFSRELGLLRALDCACRVVYQQRRNVEQARWQKLSWEQRIQHFLNSVDPAG